MHEGSTSYGFQTCYRLTWTLLLFLSLPLKIHVDKQQKPAIKRPLRHSDCCWRSSVIVPLSYKPCNLPHGDRGISSLRGCQDCTEIVRLSASSSSQTAADLRRNTRVIILLWSTAPGALFLTLCFKYKQEVGAAWQKLCQEVWGSVEATVMWLGSEDWLFYMVDKWVIEILFHSLNISYHVKRRGLWEKANR